MNRILVLADQWDHFTYWCSIQEPRENPKDRKFVVITPDTLRRGLAHGWHRQEGDRFIRINSAPYGWPGRWHNDEHYESALHQLEQALIPAGWIIEEAERHKT